MAEYRRQQIHTFHFPSPGLLGTIFRYRGAFGNEYGEFSFTFVNSAAYPAASANFAASAIASLAVSSKSTVVPTPDNFHARSSRVMTCNVSGYGGGCITCTVSPRELIISLPLSIIDLPTRSRLPVLFHDCETLPLRPSSRTIR